MEAIFIKVLNMSISAGWLILAVMLLRLLLKKAPKWIFVVLWGLVGFRLVLPFSLQSVFSLIPSAEVISPSIGYARHPEINSGVSVIDNAVNQTLGTSLAATPMNSANPMQIVLFLGGIIWTVGIAILLLYGLISYLRLRRKVAEAIPYEKNTWLCDQVKTPFILGVFRPRIYLPSGLNEEETAYVLAHEYAHLKRKDHLWKPLGFLLLTIYWFNPLVWVAYILLCRDVEAACDEKVISDMEMTEKKAYANALVSCSMQRRLILACPLAFGEVGVKERVKGILNYKKPAFWIIVAALIACVVLAVCFLTNPKDDGPDLSFLNYKNAISLIGQNDTAPYANLYPADSDGVQPGVADAKAFAQFLESAEWTKRRAPSSSPEPRGYLEFVIEDDYRIIVYQSERLAAVRFGSDIRYYRTGTGDYEAARATFIPAPSTEPDRLRDNLFDTELNLSDPLAFLLGFADAQVVTVVDETSRSYENGGKSFDEIVSAQAWTAHRSEGFPSSAPDRLIVIISGDLELRIEEQAGECLYMAYPIDTGAFDPVIYFDCGKNLMDELMPWAAYEAGKPMKEAKPRMTLNDVYALADKGMALIWPDLLAFEGKEIGSGQLIWRFPINDSYCLEAYDGELDGSPERVLLIQADENGEFRAGPGLYIDIFTQDIDAFLSGAQTRSVMITSGGVTIEPSLYLLNEKIWTDNGWIVTDGEPLAAALEDADQIPTLTLADDFIVRFDGYVRKSGLQLYDEQFNLLRENWYGDTAVNWLAPGSYYGVIETFGPAGRYIASEGASEESVYRCVFRLNAALEGANPYTPETVAEKTAGLAEAKLRIADAEYALTDADSMAKLEDWLKNAELLPAGAGCPFGSVLTLIYTDGSKISCCPAEDSCGTVFANGAFYRYAHDNEAFWALFGIQLR
ncbi:MAG: hypothetical protein IKP82_04335 [Oscillospiraceae bacterium]|nr:hypothetical protein [Oscillospiraceae bacterium]